MAKSNIVKSTADYQELSTQLDAVLAALQSPDVHIDDAVDLYERGLKLVRLLEARIKEAENKITKLKVQAGGK